MHNGKLPQSADDPLVQRFISKWSLAGPAIFLDYKDCGYEPSWCHISAKHRAVNEGGKRVHGWALWQFGVELVAEHHSVWEPEKDVLVDVTPPSNGGAKVLFVRDDISKIEFRGNAYELFTDRTADAAVHWLWQGNPSEYSNWPCPPDKNDLVEYCKKLDFPVSAIVTEGEFG